MRPINPIRVTDGPDILRGRKKGEEEKEKTER